MASRQPCARILVYAAAFQVLQIPITWLICCSPGPMQSSSMQQGGWGTSYTQTRLASGHHYALSPLA